MGNRKIYVIIPSGEKEKSLLLKALKKAGFHERNGIETKKLIPFVYCLETQKRIYYQSSYCFMEGDLVAYPMVMASLRQLINEGEIEKRIKLGKVSRECKGCIRCALNSAECKRCRQSSKRVNLFTSYETKEQLEEKMSV